MARITEEASATISMNMEPARKALTEATADAKRFREELEAILSVPEKDRSLDQKMKIPALKSDLAKAEKQVASAKEKLTKFQDTLKNLNASSFNDLYKASKQLEAQIKRLKPGTEEYIAATHDLQMVNTRLNDLRKAWKAVSDETEKSAAKTQKAVKKSSSALDTVAKSFQKYWSMFDVAMRTVTGISMRFRQCAEDAAKLDDAFAQVMKTTGLTRNEVAKLNEAFRQMDTRTTIEQLNKMAYEAGKLGYNTVEDVRQFVEAADIINVALGDVLGEGATLEIAKLANVFSQSTKEIENLDLKGKMLAVGSAVNQLGKESTASESYMVDFLGRLGGVATQAKLSADQILGYASALDQMKQKVEMSATAFQKLIQQMIKKPEEFVEAARMPLEEFTRMMETDMNGAIKRVLEGFNEMGGFTQLVPIFKDMGLDGARAASVIASLAANLDKVSEAQATANEHIRLGTSMTREYEIMNSSMEAQLEKARKEFKNASVALGQSLNPVLLKSTKGVTYLIKALANYGKEIKTVAVVTATLIALMKAKSIVMGAVYRWKKLLIAGTRALAAAQALLSGNLELARIQWTKMSLAMKGTALGLAAAAVSGLVIWVQRLIEKKREAAEAAQWEQKLEEKATEAYAEEAARMGMLTRIVESNNVSLESRRKALEELKRIVPGYHADLTEEGILINNNKDALISYTDALKKAARIKVRREDIEEREAELMRLEDMLEAAEEREAKAIVDYEAKGSNRFDVEGDLITESNEYMELQAAREARTELEAQIEALGKLQDEAVARYDAIAGTVPQTAAANADAIVEATDEALQTVQSVLTQAQFQMLEDKYSQLTKKEKEMVDKGFEGISKEEAEVLKRRYDRIIAAEQNLVNKEYQAKLRAVQTNQRSEQNEANRLFFEGEITADQHEERLRGIRMAGLQTQLELARKYGQDTAQIEANILTERINTRKAEYELELKEVKACYAKEVNAQKLMLAAGVITQEEYDGEILALRMQSINERLGLAKEYGQDETAILQEMLDAQFEAERAAAQKMGELRKKAKEVLDGLRSPSDARNAEMQEKLARLDELHEAMLLSEEQYEMAVFQLRRKYAQEDLKEKLANVEKYAEKVNSVMSDASEFVSSLKEAETAKLEAEYQAQLTAAGDNAERREQIENEYEQKQLELKKKYADTEMAINIAKTIASGSVAAIKAYAEGGPYAGVVLAALIAATTAAEVATIVQQRNAIKNSSVASTGGSTGDSVGQRVMTGYADGGYTGTAASDRKAVGVVHANEYVVPAWMVRKNPVMIANLEQYRRSGSLGKSGSAAHGFAAGGYTGNAGHADTGSSASPSINIEAAVEAAIRRVMADGAIRAYLVRKDLEELDNQTARFKAKTTR